MKIVTIIGARPQFIKAAAVSRLLRRQHTEILVHTGQHYDSNMSDVFFEELVIPRPEVHLNIGSGSHGVQTGAMLAKIEAVLNSERPDWVLVYGDTNSTLAGALAAAKLHIPIAHVEAGLRSFNRAMPEEVNRVLTDHVSNCLLCPSQTAVDNLAVEGIKKNVYMVGDVMYDALLFGITQASQNATILSDLGLQPGRYLLATVHRAENTDDPNRLCEILSAFNQIDTPVIFPVHPRTRARLNQLSTQAPIAPHVRLIDPVGYLDMVTLEQSAQMILTDSGGIQKEAYWLGVPCVTMRDETEWVETVKLGCNILVGASAKQILKAITQFSSSKEFVWDKNLYGEPNAAARCIAALER